MGNEVRMEKLFPTCGFSIPAPLNLLGNRVENGGRIFYGVENGVSLPNPPHKKFMVRQFTFQFLAHLLSC